MPLLHFTASASQEPVIFPHCVVDGQHAVGQCQTARVCVCAAASCQDIRRALSIRV